MPFKCLYIFFQLECSQFFTLLENMILLDVFEIYLGNIIKSLKFCQL